MTRHVTLQPCGTRAAYARGCHCEACTTASRNYHRAMRGDTIFEEGVPVGPPAPGPWVEQAACRGAPTDAFFPGRGENLDAVRAVCSACSVRPECLAWALSHPTDDGFYGGLSSRSRRALRRAALAS